MYKSSQEFLTSPPGQGTHPPPPRRAPACDALDKTASPTSEVSARYQRGATAGTSYGKMPGKCWENVGNCWENVGNCWKMLGKYGKLWEKCGKLWENVGNGWKTYKVVPQFVS